MFHSTKKKTNSSSQSAISKHVQERDISPEKQKEIELALNVEKTRKNLVTWFGLTFLCTIILTGSLSYKAATLSNENDPAPIENFISLIVTAQVGFGGIILGYYFGTQKNQIEK